MFFPVVIVVICTFGHFNIVDEFSPEKVHNERGENGFGSTGMNDSDKAESEEKADEKDPE